jgi:hypothetical protein
MPRNYPHQDKTYTYPVDAISNPTTRTDGRMTTQEWLRHNERLTSGTVAGTLTGIAHGLGASPEVQDGLYTLGTGIDQAFGPRRRVEKARGDISGAWRGARDINSEVPQYRY